MFLSSQPQPHFDFLKCPPISPLTLFLRRNPPLSLSIQKISSSSFSSFTFPPLSSNFHLTSQAWVSRHPWHGRLPGSWALLNLVELIPYFFKRMLKSLSMSSLLWELMCLSRLMSHRLLVLFWSLFCPTYFDLDGFFHCVFRVSLGSFLHPWGPYARTLEDPLRVGACCTFNAYLYEARLAKPSQEGRTAYF